MTFIRVTVYKRYVFWLSPFGLTLKNGYLHSGLSSGTVIAHLIPNWSWREDIRHGECSWTLTDATAVDVSISALYFMCLCEGGNLHCQERPPPSLSVPCSPSYTLTVLWKPNHPGQQCVSVPPLNPVNTTSSRYRCPETDPGLLWTYAKVEHCKTHLYKADNTHAQCWWKNGQTNFSCDDKLLVPGGKQPWASERYCST